MGNQLLEDLKDLIEGYEKSQSMESDAFKECKMWREWFLDHRGFLALPENKNKFQFISSMWAAFPSRVFKDKTPERVLAMSMEATHE